MDYDNKENTAELVRALRSECGQVKRSTLLESANAIESLQKENAFLKEMQRLLTAGLDKAELGTMVNHVWNYGDWRK